MRPRVPSGRRPPRSGASAAELALLLPLLGLIFLVTLDFARLYYYYSIVTNCARNGALYASDPVAAHESPYASMTAAAQAEATDQNNTNNLSSTLNVTSTNGTDAAGNPYVEVTVAYPFQTLSNYPGLSNPINLTRTIRVRVAPTTPN
jgi:Flp pilus assembly protein TadG